MLMQKPEAEQPDFFLAVTDARAVDTAILLAHKLRTRGLSGECDYQSGSMKSRLRHAGRIKAKKCYILGADEFDSDQVTVKDMEDGEQLKLDLAVFD
jgi:histidyl-tRNA synthetase